ncbi:MAG: CGNR zinc finger domain-containing protein [Anaeromyxobacteraceae bacterium]
MLHCEERPRFSFHRGSLALDFVGTVGGRASPSPEERLPDPAALSAWLGEAGFPIPARVDEGDLEEARALREALFQLATDALEGRRSGRAALARVNAAARGVRHGALVLGADGRRAWAADDAVRLALGRVAEDGILVLSDSRDRLARCELPGCGALLLSRSRSDRRRWCSMETCGNRAKVAAFRARQKARGD